MILVTVVLTTVAAASIFFGMGYMFALLCIGLLPGIVAYVIDNRRGHFASKTVLAFNVAGLAPHLAASLSRGGGGQGMASLFQNPAIWGMIYGVAGFGWVVVWLMPRIVYRYLEIRAEFISRKMEFFQGQLVDEWGEAVKPPARGKDMRR